MGNRLIDCGTGVRLACTFDGDPGAPPMVLLHGLGEGAVSWQPVTGRFAADFRVIAVDLRGHGGSDHAGEYSFELMREDVLGLLDALGLPDVVLVGHSMGGTVAYLVAMARPDRVNRLVVEDVPPPFPRDRAIPSRPDGELPFDWAVVPAIATEVNDATRRWWPGLRAVTAPTLLIGGGATSHIPQTLLAEVADAIPDCTLVTIAAGHAVHETQPTRFADTVLGWLRADPT